MTVAEAVQIFLDMDAVAAVALIVGLNLAAGGLKRLGADTYLALKGALARRGRKGGSR